MTTPLTINVDACEDRGRSNGFLSTTFKSNQKGEQRRLHSVAPSEKSHITLVEENSDIPSLKYSGSEKDNQFERQNKSSKKTLIWNHLRQAKRHLGEIIRVIFTNVAPIVEISEAVVSDPNNGFATASSVYIRSVYVLSTEKYDEHHFRPKCCRCIFDTGNHQGNVVSKMFLLERLGYTESDFLKLTETEQASGFGITNQPFVPLGAIRLTWYHDMSTRLFSDMRFLISPYSHTDLIIGAQSIEQYNILGKPNLYCHTNPERKPVRAELERERGQLEHNIAMYEEKEKCKDMLTDDKLSSILKLKKKDQENLEKVKNDLEKLNDEEKESRKRTG
ncbi:hypothetical protein BP6252_08953 [Coleophoma cylindrospora]|uniref:Uncharacterized protein n=1 Tax=Coleophoma cylindrospora TaxID=1849047 RepID=A0A3D8R0J6_9HELO|nr:hypothetical protein BP6252_08953 [Coleophoma cylindrospora]